VRVSDRVGKGIRTAPRDAMIADVTPTDRVGRAFGFHRAMDHLGAVIGPLIATALLARGLPLRQVFLWAAVPGVVSWLIVLAIRERAMDSATARDDAPPHAEDPHATLPSRLRRYLWILLVFSLAGSTDAFLILRARDLGLAATTIPLLWSVLHVSKAVWTQGGGILADRLSRPTLLVLGWLVYAGIYAGFALAQSAAIVWPLVLVYGMYYGLTEPTEKAMVRDLAPAAARGRAFGWYNFVIGASALPASAAAGWVWQHAGARTALTMDALIALVACALITMWARSARPAAA
jgi:MFS family permease